MKQHGKINFFFSFFFYKKKIIFSGKEKLSNIVNKRFANNPSLMNQVYMVPLPDFTVYPEGIDDKQKNIFHTLKIINLVM